MPVAAPLIIGAATVGGALLSSSAAKKAAKAQTQSADAAIAEQRRQYDLNRADLAPWRQAGGQAVTQAFNMLQPGFDYTTSPGYQFRFGEGIRAIDSGAASKGMLMSGGTLKDEMRFGQGLASQDYNDQFNRLSTLAGLGSASTTAGAQLGQQSAQNIGNLLTQQGNARASGYIGSANAINGGLQGLASLAGYFMPSPGGGMSFGGFGR